MDMTEAEARKQVALIRTACEDVLARLVDLHDRRGWIALRYESWAAMCRVEFAGFQLPRAQRQQAVAELTEAGMGTRAIGAAVGVDHATVVRDRSGGADAPPGETIGLDGKRYTRPTKKTPPPPPPEPGLVDLQVGLVRIAAAVAMAGDVIANLGRPAVEADEVSVGHMLTVTKLVTEAFGPFVALTTKGSR